MIGGVFDFGLFFFLIRGGFLIKGQGYYYYYYYY